MNDIEAKIALGRFTRLRHWVLVLDEIRDALVIEKVKGKRLEITEEWAALLKPMTQIRVVDELRCDLEREAEELARKHGDSWSTLSEANNA